MSYFPPASFAAAAHAHSGADITSGTVAAVRLASHTHAGADIASGSIADARLSANVMLLDAAQAVTGNKTFNTGTLLVKTNAGGAATNSFGYGGTTNQSLTMPESSGTIVVA